MASTFTELNEKLAKAVEENTKAQTKATEMTGETGKEIRRLAKNTAQLQKRQAFIEKDLGAELGESLSAPFKTLAKVIPKPIRTLGMMPVQAAMRAQAQADQRVDPSGTILPPASGAGIFKGALSETMGKEIAEKGYLGGIKSMFTGPGGSPELDILKETKKHTVLLEKIEEALSPKRVANLGRGSGFRETGIEGKRKLLGAPLLAGGVGTMGAGSGGFGMGGGGAGFDWGTAATTGGGILATVGSYLGIKKLMGMGGKGFKPPAIPTKTPMLLGGGGGGAASATATAGAGTMAAAIYLPIVGAAMGIKDALDYWGSREEKWAKGGENIGGMAGTGVGAVVGGILGQILIPIPGVGMAIGAGVGAIMGNVVGETMGKAVDSQVDKETKAQLGALGMKYDELQKRKKLINESDMALADKKEALYKLERDSNILKAEAIEVEKRQAKINKLIDEKRAAEYRERNAEIREQFKQGVNSPEYQALVDEAKDNQEKIKELKGATTDAEIREKIELEEKLAKQMELIQTIKSGRPYDQYRDKIEQAQEAFLDASNSLDDLDLSGWGDKAELKKLQSKLQAIEDGTRRMIDGRFKIVTEADLTEDERIVAEEWIAVRNEYMKEQKTASSAIQDEIDELVGERKEAADMVDWEARLRGTDRGYNEQRTAVDVGPGLHDVPAGKSYQRHAQELMGEVYTEYDPSQTPQEKAYREIFGETMAGGTARWWDTAGPTGQSGMGVEGSMQGAKQFPVYISEAYKKMAASSESQEQVDDTLMAMQSVLSTGRFAGSAITTDQRTGDKMWKYSELQAMKERMGGYDDKFVSHRGEKIMDNEKRRALGMDELVEGTMTQGKFGIGTSDMWHQAMLDDDAMMAMGGPRLGKLHAGGRYLSSAASSGGLGLLNDEMLDFYGLTMSAEDRVSTSGVSATDSQKYTSDIGRAMISTGEGSGKTVGIFTRMLETEKEVVEGVGKDKTSIRKTSATMAEVMFQTFKDGFFEIAAGVGDETKFVAGQIKTEDDIQNVLENLASLTGEGMDSNVLSGLREQLELSLETGAFGFEDLTKTGRIEQVGPHGDAWKVTKKGEELYAKSFGQGGRQKGIPGAAVGGTEEYRRAQFLAGMSPDAGELPKDLMLGELAWGADTTVRTERIGPQRGGRGSEGKYPGNIGMTMNGATTYALPPSSGVQGTPLTDPYANELRDSQGRMVNKPQYRPAGVSDMDNYPDWFWQKYGMNEADLSNLSGEEIRQLQEKYKKSNPLGTGIPGATQGFIPGPKGPQVQQKRVLLDAAAASSSAGGGGGTNIVVNAPSTSNSNSTVQKIDANPLMSNNPRRPPGVAYG